jgi:hypothetical protein
MRKNRRQRIRMDESLDRPGWTSEQSTGNLLAFRHKHTIKGLKRDYYVKTKGKR